jgi:hypothetical protein
LVSLSAPEAASALRSNCLGIWLMRGKRMTAKLQALALTLYLN